jgi:hypothetical protein
VEVIEAIVMTLEIALHEIDSMWSEVNGIYL